MVQNRSPHQLDRLLRRMIELLLVRTAHDEFRTRGIPDRGVLAGFAVPGRVLLPHLPARLMLIPVMSPSKDRPALVPDDLLWIEETNAEQPVQHFACIDTGVPDVGDL